MINCSLENTFLLLKPDAVQRGMIGRLISRIEEKGLKIVAMKMLQITLNRLQSSMNVITASLFTRLLSNLSPVRVPALHDYWVRGAISICRRLMGSTSPENSQPGTIRGDYSLDVKHNLIHGSDSLDSFAHEAKVYFSEEEIIKYRLTSNAGLIFLKTFIVVD